MPPRELAIVIIMAMAVVVALILTLVDTLTKHQRKMAELIAQNHRQLAEIEERSKLAPALAVENNEMQLMRDRMAQMEAKLAEKEAPAIVAQSS